MNPAMTREDGLRQLGLDARATKSEIALAYRTRSLPLKTQILSAPRATLKERYRGDLRTLVLARDAALGKPLPERWRGDRIGIRHDELIDALREIPADRLDAARARAFLGVSPKPKALEVQDAYTLRSRVLIRRFAHATDDAEMAAVRRARLKLRTIRNFALPG